MPLRMLVYIVRIWERCAREAPDEPLPIVVPVLVSHADGRRMPTRMHELVAPIPDGLAELASLVPEFRILVDDLTRTSSEVLRARSLAQFPKLALWLLRDGRSADALIAGLVEWSAAFHAVAEAPDGIQALVKLLRYLDIVLSEEHYGRFRAKLLELAPNTEEAIMRYGERLIAEGRAEGRAEGVVDGQRTALLKQLRLKFGEVDEAAQVRVATASAAELERWLERILIAESVAAVFES